MNYGFDFSLTHIKEITLVSLYLKAWVDSASHFRLGWTDPYYLLVNWFGLSNITKSLWTYESEVT